MNTTARKTALAIATIATLLGATFTGVGPAAAVVPPNAFQVQTGTIYQYVRESSTTFASITSNLNANWYSSRGVSDIRVYCPYKASSEWRGVPAIDFLSTNTNTGTVTDFQNMVTAAHAKGITVTMYISLLFVHTSNALWTTAQTQKGAGQNTATTQLFRWATTNTGAAPEQGDWAWSATANSYYATSWGFPALNYTNLATRDYAKTVLKFWMDKGVDGFEYDAPSMAWGITNAYATDIMVTTPKTYTSNSKWLAAEGAVGSWDNPYSDSIGLTHVLINGDNDVESLATQIMNGTGTANQLETRFVNVLDARRAAGLGSNAWSLYDMSLSGDKRALDAAVFAGNGAQYSTDYQVVYSQLSATDRTKYDTVFTAIKSTSALAPGASRTRVPTGSNSQYYATVRTSTDATKSALAVYNFRNVSSTITLDLTGLGVTTPQTPVNIVTGANAPAITSNSYAITVPAYGYVFLNIARTSGGGGGGTWTTTEDTAAGWTFSNYMQFSDPSASGGIDHISQTSGAYGQRTFTGTEIEVRGWKGDDGGTMQLLIDGVSRGTTSLYSPTDAYGSLYFSVTGLSAGTHTIRLQQTNATGAGWTAIDYYRTR